MQMNSPETTSKLASTPGNEAGPLDLALALMDAVEFGLIACSRSGVMLHANRAARREIGPSRPLSLEGMHLTCRGSDRSFLEAALRDADRGVHHMFWIGSGADRLMVASKPLGCETVQVASVLLVLGRRSVCSPLGLEMMAVRHGLTLTEKRVLSGLIDTRGARQIALDHGVRLSTVRTQIQSIRDKVGVRSVDELLLRVAKLPAVAAHVG